MGNRWFHTYRRNVSWVMGNQTFQLDDDGGLHPEPTPETERFLHGYPYVELRTVPDEPTPPDHPVARGDGAGPAADIPSVAEPAPEPLAIAEPKPAARPAKARRKE